MDQVLTEEGFNVIPSLTAEPIEEIGELETDMVLSMNTPPRERKKDQR